MRSRILRALSEGVRNARQVREGVGSAGGPSNCGLIVGSYRTDGNNPVSQLTHGQIAVISKADSSNAEIERPPEPHDCPVRPRELRVRSKTGLGGKSVGRRHQLKRRRNGPGWLLAGGMSIAPRRVPLVAARPWLQATLQATRAGWGTTINTDKTVVSWCGRRTQGPGRRKRLPLALTSCECRSPRPRGRGGRDDLPGTK